MKYFKLSFLFLIIVLPTLCYAGKLPNREKNSIVMPGNSILKSNTLNDLVEQYIDEYGLPDKVIERIISRAGILYQ